MDTEPGGLQEEEGKSRGVKLLAAPVVFPCSFVCTDVWGSLSPLLLKMVLQPASAVGTFAWCFQA